MTAPDEPCVCGTEFPHDCLATEHVNRVITLEPFDHNDGEWLAHLAREVAAIGEGFCPTCSGRLVPVEGEPGNTGRCPADGLWRAYTDRDRREGRHDTWVSWTPPTEAIA